MEAERIASNLVYNSVLTDYFFIVMYREHATPPFFFFSSQASWEPLTAAWALVCQEVRSFQAAPPWGQQKSLVLTAGFRR